MSRHLVIWLPNWPVERLRRTRPELAGQPVILHHTTRRGECVVACAPEACRQGVHVGMPIAEALSRPGITRSDLLPSDPQADLVSLQKLARWCHRFSPLVGLEEASPPQSLLLDLTQVAALVGGEYSLARHIGRSLREFGLTSRLAIADTTGTAWAIAHATGDRLTEPSIVEPGGDAAALMPLPLWALRLPDEMIHTLQRCGIASIGQLLSLPRAELPARFGPLLLRRVDQALGNLPEVIQAVAADAQFVAEWSLEHSLTQPDLIETLLRQVIAHLTQQLRAQDQGALQLVCRFTCETTSQSDGNAAPVQFEVGLFRPAVDTEHLFQLVQMRLERVTLPGPIMGCSIQATRFASPTWRQQRLFGEAGPREDSAEVTALVDRLTSRLGRQAVLRCQLQQDAQPERAYRVEPLIDQSQAGKSGKTRLPLRPSAGPLGRPVQLLVRPILLQLVAGRPDGLPVRFVWQDQPHDVARHWGPERIETGWWRKAHVRRDYFRVETTTGQRFWLYRDLTQDSWFLHGLFG